MKNLIIGTTAMNRPTLHNDTIKSWNDYFMKSDFNITWVINIDTNDILPFTWDETKDNFRNIIDDKIKIKFLPKKKSNFFTSCLVVSDKIINYVDNNNLNEDNTYVFWLEDDWILNQNVLNEFDKNLDYFLRFMNEYDRKLVFVNFSGLRENYFWALAPCFLKLYAFKKLHYEGWKVCDEYNLQNWDYYKGDPESLAGFWFLKRIYKNLSERTTKTFPCINIVFKKLNAKYDLHAYFNWEKSRNLILENYKDQEITLQNVLNEKNIIKFIKQQRPNKYIFIRTKPKLTYDIGRNYMKTFIDLKNLDYPLIHIKNFNPQYNNPIINIKTNDSITFTFNNHSENINFILNNIYKLKYGSNEQFNETNIIFKKNNDSILGNYTFTFDDPQKYPQIII